MCSRQTSLTPLPFPRFSHPAPHKKRKRPLPLVIETFPSLSAPVLISHPRYLGGYSWELLVGVCRPVLQILTLFQTKNVIQFHTRFQTRAQLLAAWLALTSFKYLDNVLVLILLNQWLKPTMVWATQPWSYENRLSEHCVISLNFPCLIACLLSCLLMCFFCSFSG